MHCKLLAATTAFTVLVPLTYGFLDTAPLVIWSSHENALISGLNEKRPGLGLGLGEVQLDTLLLGREGEDVFGFREEMCRFDAVLVIEQPGLHATDLKSLSPSSTLPTRLNASHTSHISKPKSAQLPYIKRHTPDELSSTAESLAQRCGVGRVSWVNRDGEFELVQGEKEKGHVLYMTLPEVYGEPSWRRYQMTELENSLNTLLTKIESTFPKHLIIYTGSSPLSSSSFEKRQLLPPLSDPKPFSFAPNNSTTTGTGILAHYQLLTPGLILSLFIALFLLLPAVLMAISALASIQSSVRLDAPKGPSQTKKNQ
ncbi:uncharacterized protein FOMMEDRAFT_21312 [Fomitiporia mediterranea MF3/22]|uniref:uncharacterized protein n=1 Tax=Fomitiporia mediterranea (strain MF3/22) TaxID=694068 RepID=UPI000440888D|nr:uncharacterized protein FOMMEDRAFT_21312 [Fomitiporia mediterranea MF3/22]EJD00805.1 hypothetical protein FOMMEDRAFT_21312 [Fomitiporia mediterranea MF3/22]